MAKVVSSINSPLIVKKKTISEKRATLTRVATDLQLMGDVNFGELGEDKDGLLVSYDAATDKFILVEGDKILLDSISDNDVPDTFVRELEEELRLGQIAVDNLDGGSF